MGAKIIEIAQLQQRYSGSYAFTVTDEPDLDYRKYLSRKLRDVISHVDYSQPAGSVPLDISLDDLEGDVVAGISAVTYRATLVIDMLWVDEPLRGRGMGHRLLQMAEYDAVKRGCRRAWVRTTASVAFFVGLGYTISGTVQTIPFREGDASARAVYWLAKDLT